MKDHILIDAGFLIALAFQHDKFHSDAIAIAKDIGYYNLLCPWPITYEILRTKHTNRFDYLQIVRHFFASDKVILHDDTLYREACLKACLNTKMGDRSLSLIDMVLRAIMENNHWNIGYLATFNSKDFIDICGQYNIDLLPDPFYRS